MTERTPEQPPTSPSLNIDRCVCGETTFATMNDWLKDQDFSSENDAYDAVRRQFHCGLVCGLCRPYLREMIRTGETVFQATLPATMTGQQDDDGAR